MASCLCNTESFPRTTPVDSLLGDEPENRRNQVRATLSIRRVVGPADVAELAVLPLGASEPRWFMQGLHMNPAEAVQAHLDLEAAQSIGMYFGTFRMTTEGIDEPLLALEQACRVRKIPPSRFGTLGFGESVRLG